LSVAVIFAFTSCSQNGSEQGESSEDNGSYSFSGGMSKISDDVSQKTILQIAAENEDFSTLVAAVHAAEIEDVLSNPGPITLFAPNNEAFDKLPEGTLDDLLKPENKDKLRDILYYHAAPGVFKDEVLKKDQNLFVVSGHYIPIKVDDNGNVTVQGANILATVNASNGVIHVIDQVLLPPEE